MREVPAGLDYHPDFLTAAEESDVLALLEPMEFHEVVMRGQAAKRTTRHFGYDYGYESREVRPGEAIPDDLLWLRDRCGALADVPGGDLVEVLVTRYPEGAGIGWHRDAPMFGPAVIGVSLLSPCRMRFQRRQGGLRRVHDVDLAPRSAYVIGGEARRVWQHSIPATKALRYSITFRSLRGRS